MRAFSGKAGIIGGWLLALLLLGGCSAVRIGYNQAPTLAWWWLDSYMDFDAEQAPRVKGALEQWFAWQRRTQLADYAELLAAAQTQVMQPATPQQICRWSDELRTRAATALAHGVPIAIHSDAPITPLDPLFTAWCAVNRITASGRRLGPSERIGVAQALRTITLGAAYTLKLDREIGSIECGKHADFAVLEDDPLEVAPERLREVRVWGTVSAGRVFPVSAL